VHINVLSIVKQWQFSSYRNLNLWIFYTELRSLSLYKYICQIVNDAEMMWYRTTNYLRLSDGHTLFNIWLSGFSISIGVLCSNTYEDSLSKGNTLRNIIVAMNKEHTGSAMNNPNLSIRMDETITPTLPSVSATTWRNTPRKQQTNHY